MHMHMQPMHVRRTSGLFFFLRTEPAGVLEDLDDRAVEVSLDDLGMRVLAPQTADGITELGVVVLGHAVDVA